ncbi:hypothetical protein LSAT2_015266 [Lamellibrachia satsuma]|nr:hypothetical protein LSAT2_015266 [Lamellibrachia satsuma]
MWPATVAIHPWNHVDRGASQQQTVVFTYVIIIQIRPKLRHPFADDGGHSARVTGDAVMVTSGGSSPPTCKRSLQNLKKWAKLHGNIHEVTHQQKEADSVSVNVQSNLQVLQTFVQPVHVRAVCHSKTQQNHATVVALHKSAHTEIRVWLQRPQNSHLKHMTFVIKTDIQKMIFLENHKLFAAYCKDMTLRMYSDYQYGFKEVSVNCCRQTVLCMAYSGETNELFGGGVGCVLRWEVAALSGALKVLRPCDINFAENEIIQHMSVNSGYQTLVIHTHFNVYIWNYMLQVHLHKYEICQDPSLTCVVFHPPEDLIITASVGGNIQVWSWAGQFTLLHELAGHNDPITEMLVHPSQPVLISSSLDCTIRLWRLDLFVEQQKIEVGEPVLGMMFVDTDEIVYWSASTLKMFQLNLFYQLVTGLQADILDVFSSSSSNYSNRLVVTGSDGSVRILCPVSGAAITIVYPLPCQLLPAQTVYERTDNQLYLLINGEVLVYGCDTNPAHNLYKLQPSSEDEQILCIAHMVMEDRGQGTEKSYVFTGLADGHICLLYATTELMSEAVLAHEGPVNLLESAYHSPSRKHTVPTLVSYGRDLHIHVWHVVFVKDAISTSLITLQLMYSMEVQVCLLHIRMMDNTICFSKTKNIGKVHMYELHQGELHHSEADDHTDIINGIACSPLLGLFATSADDGLIKVWNKQNSLIREMVFDSSLRGVCFANKRGDILVGVQGLVNIVPTRNYLPQTLLDELHDTKIEEDYPEKALPFDTDLELWVKLDKVKAYPVDLVDRRFMWLKEDKKRDKHRKWEAQRREEEAIEKEHLLKQQELEYHMRKQLMTQPLVPRPDSAASTRNRRTSRLQSVAARGEMAEDDALAKLSVMTSEEKAVKDIIAAEELITSDDSISSKGLPSPPVGPIEMSNITMCTIDLHWHPPDTTGGFSIVYVIDVQRICHSHKFHCIGCVKAPAVQLTDLLYSQTYSVQVFAHNKMGNSLPLTSAMIYPLKKKRKGTVTAAEAKEALEQRKTGERSRRQQEDKKKVDILLEQKKVEEERRRKTIIAPDGHIPNSVVRGQIGYTLPPDPIMNRALENMAFMAEMDGAVGLWKHFKRRNMISWKDKLTSRGFHSTAVYDDEEEAGDETKSPEQKRQQRIGSPFTPELELKIAESSSLDPRISIYDGVRDRISSMTPTPQIEVESDSSRRDTIAISPDTRAEVDKAVAVILPGIFQELLEELWFPFSYIPPMSELIDMFLELLDSADPATLHKQICNYLIQIYGHFGYTEETLKLVVDKLVEQLAHHHAMIRQNCINTLQKLGLKKTEIVSKIVPMLGSTNSEMPTSLAIPFGISHATFAAANISGGPVLLVQTVGCMYKVSILIPACLCQVFRQTPDCSLWSRLSLHSRSTIWHSWDQS